MIMGRFEQFYYFWNSGALLHTLAPCDKRVSGPLLEDPLYNDYYYIGETKKNSLLRGRIRRCIRMRLWQFTKRRIFKNGLPELTKITQTIPKIRRGDIVVPARGTYR